jgi:single-strand DNA-binding protein
MHTSILSFTTRPIDLHLVTMISDDGEEVLVEWVEFQDRQSLYLRGADAALLRRWLVEDAARTFHPVELLPPPDQAEWLSQQGRINTIQLSGTVAQMPEMRYSQTGRIVCSFPLNTKDTLSQEQQWDHAGAEVWHHIVVWDELGERCAKLVRYNTLLYVAGELRSYCEFDEYGYATCTAEVVAQTVAILDGGSKVWYRG